ncbi:cytoplasmic polyadenylated homeobox-like protein 2 [Tamandua tetradactyla]|uniref:cytoplasmic polyadenylated homeobox-like protein 2 n=1 Tax=Tamandua tetradactyla TaxID=48850 RepID=UPI0040548A6C
MASNGSPFEEDSHNQVRETKWRKGKGKQRHKFTKEELSILNNKFVEDPYPDFTTREELAKQVHCYVSVIDNWFQNKRARLPLRERHRLFAARKLHEHPVQDHPLPSLLDVQAEAPKYSTKQGFSCAQERGDGSSFLKKECVPSQQVDSDGSDSPGIEKEPGYALAYQDDKGRRPPPAYPLSSYSSSMYAQPPIPSVHYFNKYRPEAGRSQDGSPFLLNSVHSIHGVGEQQEEQNMAHCYYSPLQGQQQSRWYRHLQQPQQPQNFQEKPLFQEPLLKHVRHGNLGQGCPFIQSQQQSQYPQNNGQSLCSQQQQATPQRVIRSPLLPLEQDFQQGVAEHPRAQVQQHWVEESSLFHWSASQGPEK